MESTICKPARLVVARFDAGEDLYTALTKCAVENNIKTGWLCAVGGLKELSIGQFNPETREHENVRLKTTGCFEVLSVNGNIMMKEDNILVHAHIAAAAEGVVHGGHLMEGSIIDPFAEVFIQECDTVMKRTYSEDQKLWMISPGS